MGSNLSTTFTQILGILLGFGFLFSSQARAFDWVPSEVEIQKYRQSWNPLSNGPIFISGVDIHPKGQLTVHPFLFTQISEQRFGSDLTVDRPPSPTHSYQLNPLVTTAYGITNHLELNVGLSLSTFWARDSTRFNQGFGRSGHHGHRHGRYSNLSEIPPDRAGP